MVKPLTLDELKEASRMSGFEGESVRRAISIARDMTKGKDMAVYSKWDSSEEIVNNNTWMSQTSPHNWKEGRPLEYSNVYKCGWETTENPDYYSMCGKPGLEGQTFMRETKGTITNVDGVFEFDTETKETITDKEKSWCFWPHIEAIIGGNIDWLNGRLILTDRDAVKNRLMVVENYVGTIETKPEDIPEY